MVINNKKALKDYNIEKTFESGIVLQGCEVKSLRLGKADLSGSFAKIEQDGIYIYKMHISSYEYNNDTYDPLRKRKLLFKKIEIRNINNKVSQQGFTIVPLKIYFNKRGYAKIEIALAKGKKLYDKRMDLKKQQVKREIKKAYNLYKNKR